MISKLGVEAGGISKLHFIVGGDSLSAVPAIIMPSLLVYGLPETSTTKEIPRLGLTADQFTITNVVPLGANYAADYLGIANNVKTFAQSANIINLTVYNDKSGYDAVTAMGGGSPGRYFQIDAPGDTYSSVASRHQMNYGFTAGLSNIDYDFTRVKPIAMPPLYTHQSINAVTSELAGAQLVENNWVSLSAAGYAGIMLSAPGETAASASKYLQQELGMFEPLAKVAGVFVEGVLRIGSLAHPAVAIGTFLAGLFAGKALGSKSPVLPSLPKPEAGYTRVIHTDPQTGLVVVVDSGSDRTIVHYADGSRRTYDLEGNVTLNRPDGTTSFRNADGEGMLRIGASGTTVLLNPEDMVDLLPASVVRISTPGANGSTVIRDYAPWSMTSYVGNYGSYGSGAFVATQPASTVATINSADVLYADAAHQTLASIARDTGIALPDLVKANSNLSADMSMAPGTKVVLPGADVFSLFINPTPASGKAEKTAASDFNAEASRVEQGVVSSGAGWVLGTDASRLNENQSQFGHVDNTAAAAYTQILSNDFRPGNGNLATPVMSTNLSMLGTGFFNSLPDILGSWLNIGNAQAQFTWPTDPLVLDLNGDGVRLTSFTTSGVLFDIDNDGGSREQTGWVSAADGLVVQDLDGDGRIRNSSELLSEYFGGRPGSAGNPGEKRYANGFAALASLDSNGDRQFDSRDAAWNSVKIWVDANQDGKSWIDTDGDGELDAGERSELKSMSELGISRIDLASQAQSGEIRDGNEVLARGSFVQSGVTREALAANFLANPLGSISRADGTGRVVQSDDALKAYVAGSAQGERIDLAAKGVNNAVGGAGNDTLIGDAGNNWLAGGQGSDRLDGGAGNDVLLIDSDDLQANIQGGAGMDIAQVIGDKGVSLDMTKAGVEIAQGGRGKDVFIGGGRGSVFMRGGDGGDILVGGSANDAMDGENDNDYLDGGAGNDVLRGGRGADTLLGGAGNDLLDGGLDDDVLSGGAGNDILRGGNGDDRIDGGDGVDVLELSGSFADYRISKGDDGIWISDTVAGRDGTDFVRGVEKANFSDVGLVDIPGSGGNGLTSPLPVRDVLDRDAAGIAFDRTQPHLIAGKQLLANDISFQGAALKITALHDVTGGTASLTANSDVLFTPASGYGGIMGFKYTVGNASGGETTDVVDRATGKTATMRAAVYLRTPDMPRDPLTVDQWYLSAANILPVWKDYTGKGVRIAQFEPGGSFAMTKEIFDYRHSDLKANVDPFWLANATPGRLAGEGSQDRFSNHATLVAGVMAAANNGEGGVGVAYDATVAGYWIDGGDFSALDQMQRYDVVNHSWGGTTNFGLRFVPVGLGIMAQSYLDAIWDGRGGLGTIIVSAGGNDRAEGGNTNYSNISNSRSSIVVGAINATSDLGALQFGGQPFSSPGASILVSAPGSNVTSTSQLIRNASGSSFGADAQTAQGTSFATPIVSGIVALMLEANPNLGYRDVQQILALSATRVEDSGTAWATNGARNWNGGGMHVSHDYGYGEVDARAAVRLAESWITQQTAYNEVRLAAPPASGQIGLAIPDGNGSAAEAKLTVDSAPLVIEHVEVLLDITHANPGDLVVTLRSPSGTESVLVNRPGKAPGQASDRGDALFRDSSRLSFVLDSALLRGESPQGTWTLRVTDAVSGATGTLNSWSMNVYGSASSAPVQYVYTNEYAQLSKQAGRNVLTVAPGAGATINAAAISSGSTIDLSVGKARLAGADLTMTNPQAVANAIGGEFDDTLIGNGLANLLAGGQGNDTLRGGGGNDTLDGGLGNDTLAGGAGADLFVIRKKSGAVDIILDAGQEDMAQGRDMIALIGFGKLDFARLTRSQVGADVRVDLGDGQILWLRNQQVSTIDAARFRFFDDASSMAAWQSSLPLIAPVQTRFDGTTGNDALKGGAGDEFLYGLDGDDILYGGDGNDLLSGGAGQDFLDGGEGDDILLLDGDQGRIDMSGKMDIGVRIGGGGMDRFVLMPDNSGLPQAGFIDTYMVGYNLIKDFDPSKDRIDLSMIKGLTGFSQLKIGKTLNRFITRVSATIDGKTVSVDLLGIEPASLNASHFLFAGNPNATVLPAETPAPTLVFPVGAPVAPVMHFQLPPPAAPQISGGAGADMLTGDAGGNLIDGGAGADTMEGRSGDDTYLVDNAGDRIIEVAGGGFDLVKSTVSYQLPGEVEALILAGNDAINGNGNGLDNRITGNSAANTLDGGAGADTMLGGLGNDLYIVDDSADRVIESADSGEDTVRSSVSYTLGANLENLELTGKAAIQGTGNAQNNRLTGNDGDNFLNGGDGDDVLQGRGGRDILNGGAGNDTYRFGAGDGQDVIVETAGSAGGVDTIALMPGITANDVLVDRTSAGLRLRLVNGEQIEAPWSAATGNAIERIAFADGTVWQAADIEQRVGRIPSSFDALQNQLVTEDKWVRFGLPALAFTQLDGTALPLIATLANGGALPAWLKFDPLTRTFEGTPGNADVGALTVKVATAGPGTSIRRSEFLITVANVNDAPLLNKPLAAQQANEDAMFQYALPANTFIDIDAGDALAYTATLKGGGKLPDWLSFNTATSTFSAKPGADALGEIDIAVTATDKAGASATASFKLNVQHVNHAPRAVAKVADQKLQKGKAFQLVLPQDTFTDPDAKDVLRYAASLNDGGPLPSWLIFDPVLRKLSGTPPGTGTLNLRITATDNAGATANMAFGLYIEAPLFTGPPVSTLPGIDGTAGADTLTGTRGVDIIRGADGDDVLYGDDGDDLLYGQDGADKLFGGAGNDKLDGGAGDDSLNGASGNDTYFLYRGMGQDIIDDFDTTPGNIDMLQIGAGIGIDQLWFKRNGLWDLDIGIIGTEDRMTIRSWEYWRKGPGWEGVQRIEQFRTADGLVLLDTQIDRMTNAMAAYTPPSNGQTGNPYPELRQAILAIASENHAPVLATPVPQQSALQGKPFQFSFANDAFTDVDSKDTLSYVASTAGGAPLPSWLSFDPATRTFSGTPPSVGVVSIRITAADNKGKAASGTFDITVAVPPVLAKGTENADIIHGKGNDDTLYGNGGDDMLYGEAGADQLYGGYGNDLLDGGAGNDLLDGGIGNDTYLVYRGMGMDRISDFDYTAGNTDTLQLGAGIGIDQLWFRKVNTWDLEISIIGSNDTITIEKWDFGRGSTSENTQRIERIRTADGKVLLDSQLDRLAQSMASYGPPPTGQTTLSGKYEALRSTVQAIANENHAPLLIAPVSNQTAFQGKPFELIVSEKTFQDVDSADVLSYSASMANGKPLPAWLTFVPGTRTLRGTPPNLEPLDLRIMANDSKGGTTVSAFRLNVEIAPVVLNGTEKGEVLRGQGGNDTLNGRGGNDSLYGEAGADVLYGEAGNDLLDGGAGNDKLDGGTGNDTYMMYRGMGADRINDFDSTTGNSDTLQMGAGISINQLWFRKTNRWDLEIGIIGSNDTMTIEKWDFWSKGSPLENAQHVERFRTYDGKLLADSQVDQLVQAMAAFSPPLPGQTTLPPAYQAALAPVLAASWK
ncbi:putative Ig domain-containing protein [Noviherbaspirillum sp. 1P10PC]|uniref:putative Ig domain-containing protein n=1 Tax=Noviherbaspirillum sp. 1P10PC TaxID=3132292 RepID=UPI00399F016B